MASCGAKQQGGKADSEAPAPADMTGGKRKTARRTKGKKGGMLPPQVVGGKKKTARRGKGKSKGKRKTARKSFLARLFKF